MENEKMQVPKWLDKPYIPVLHFAAAVRHHSPCTQLMMDRHQWRTRRCRCQNGLISPIFLFTVRLFSTLPPRHHHSPSTQLMDRHQWRTRRCRRSRDQMSKVFRNLDDLPGNDVDSERLMKELELKKARLAEDL